MSWSLLIANGDLSFNGQQMDVAQGAQKLVQDLACCVLEPMGTDDMHPDFGSVIGGGIQTDGSYNPGVIGQQNDSTSGSLVNAEIRRITANLQAQQSARYQSDVAIYGKSTLTADEVLLSVSGVTIQAAQNQMLVNASLTTGTGDLPFVVPTSTNT